MIDSIQEIYSSVKRNRLRTLLTGFAVAWGIFMLIVLLGWGNGIIHALEANSADVATNSIEVYPGYTGKAFDGLKEGRRINLNNSDAKLTALQFSDNVETVATSVRQNGVVLSNKSDYVSVPLRGVNEAYKKIEGVKITKGRFINERDISERRKTIVLHEKTIEQLFKKKASTAIGKYINAGGLMYKIVGEYTDQGNNSYRTAYTPFTSLQLIYNKGEHLNNLSFITRGLDTPEANEEFEKNYRKALGAKHRFAADDTRAIWLWNNFTHYLQTQNGLNILRTAIWIIGIFTLLSGIVGISNIMLITVKERTREFGIRKALGAKPLSILRLIILESVALTTFFGYIGMVAGIAVTEYMNATMSGKTMDAGLFSQTVFLDPTVDISIAIQATLTLVIAGTLAGLFPARKAVKIRPIEALRAE